MPNTFDIQFDKLAPQEQRLTVIASGHRRGSDRVSSLLASTVTTPPT